MGVQSDHSCSNQFNTVLITTFLKGILPELRWPRHDVRRRSLLAGTRYGRQRRAQEPHQVSNVLKLFSSSLTSRNNKLQC